MQREIIRIDQELCDGCGECIDACAEGAIALVDGKAKLVSDVYCDGLGACIGDCPTGALTIETRNADAFDEKAVETHLGRLEMVKNSKMEESAACACPGSAMRMMNRESESSDESLPVNLRSELGSWPVQLMLVPPQAPFLKGADILLCADCVPFAMPGFHSRYLKGKALLVGCPKLDDLPYYQEKLNEIFALAKPKSVTVLKMEVPCCTGISHIAIEARNKANINIPMEIQTIGIRGDILSIEKSEGTVNQAQGGM